MLVSGVALKLLVSVKRFLPFVAAIVAFVVYALTTCRGIWIGDSAEFALVLKTFGIAHPPGYPLFTLLGTIFVQGIAFFRPILAGAIFSSIIAAAAVVPIYFILRRHVTEFVAFGLSLCWAFTPIFWAETNGVEVYTLNVFLIALTYLSFESSASFKWPLTIYLFGLCLCNHPSSFALAPVIILRFVTEKEYRNYRRLPFYLSLLLVAGAMYLTLLFRSLNNPIDDWGNPQTLSALWQHMLLKQYSGWVSHSWSNLIHALNLYGRTIIECWSWPGVILIISGTIAGIRYQRARTVNALLLLLTSLAMAAFHQAVNHEPFFLPPMLASLFLVANNSEFLRKGPRLIRIGAASAACAALLLLFLNYQKYDRSDSTLYENYSRHLLDSAPPNSVLFVAGDINSFGPMYLHFAESYRPDLDLYDRSIRKQALLERASELGQMSSADLILARSILLLREHKRKFFAKSHYQNEPDWWERLDSLYSYGLLYETARPIDAPAPVPAYPASFDDGDLMSRELLVNLDLIRGEQYLQSEPPDTLAALSEFKLALGRYDAEPRGVLPGQLGIFFRKVGFGDLALETYNRALNKPILTAGQIAEIRFNISNVYKDRGNVAVQNSDYPAAAAAFEQALQYDGENSRLLLNLGLVYAQHLNDRTRAVRYLTHYLELEPADTRVKELLNSLR